jgi:hypothetical protein
VAKLLTGGDRLPYGRGMSRGEHTRTGARSTRGGLVRLLRGREDAFALALLIQVAAFVVAPAVHLIGHRPDHTHGPDGVTHTHETRRLPNGAPQPAPFHDGGGSALHFSAALTTTFVFTLALTVGLITTAQVWRPARRVFTRALFDVAAPRGPPLAI